jgi:DegV family protein with EDD domain
VTDSSCDLPSDLLEEHGIEVVPLTVHFGTEVYSDGELTVEDFWDKATGAVHPQTSQPPVGAFEEVFQQLLAACRQVLCITLTGKHSGTINAARLAAQRFDSAVSTFDSHSLSLGLGLQALAAARAAQVGRSMAEILSLLEELRGRMRLMILMDTLEYLRMGGRADAFIAIAQRMTRALNIKVTINVVEGHLRLLGASRSFKRGLKRMQSLIEEMGPLEQLAVVHTRNPTVAAAFADGLSERTGFPRQRIWLRETGAVLSVHAGPGVVGVLAVPPRGVPE